MLLIFLITVHSLNLIHCHYLSISHQKVQFGSKMALFTKKFIISSFLYSHLSFLDSHLCFKYSHP